MNTKQIISFSAICIVLLVGSTAASSEEDDRLELEEIKAPQLNEFYVPKFQVQELEYPHDYYLNDNHDDSSDGSSSDEDSDEEDLPHLQGFIPKYKRGIFDETPEINIPQTADQVLPQFQAGLPNLIPNEGEPKVREARCGPKKGKLLKKPSFGKKKK